MKDSQPKLTMKKEEDIQSVQDSVVFINLTRLRSPIEEANSVNFVKSHDQRLTISIVNCVGTTTNLKNTAFRKYYGSTIYIHVSVSEYIELIWT